MRRTEARRQAHAEPDDEAPLNERHTRTIAEDLAARRPSNKDIQKANNSCRATAAKDLQTLRSLGLLKNGHRRQAQQARTQASRPQGDRARRARRRR